MMDPATRRSSINGEGWWVRLKQIWRRNPFAGGKKNKERVRGREMSKKMFAGKPGNRTNIA